LVGGYIAAAAATVEGAFQPCPGALHRVRRVLTLRTLHHHLLLLYHVLYH
jgi:hypothetical protein